MAPKVARRVLTSERTPYGPDSEHSWILDRAATAGNGIDPLAEGRLNRARAAAEIETRAIGSSTLGGLIPAVIEPWVSEAIAFGVRSTAPLATALLRLDLPPVGMNAAWTKATAAATVTNQTAENAALTASADAVLASATDPLGTIGASLDFSSAAQERSGGWFDKVVGEELGLIGTVTSLYLRSLRLVDHRATMSSQRYQRLQDDLYERARREMSGSSP